MSAQGKSMADELRDFQSGLPAQIEPFQMNYYSNVKIVLFFGPPIPRCPLGSNVRPWISTADTDQEQAIWIWFWDALGLG